jgi:hypothetical protein
MATLAQRGPSEYTQLISRPANLGGGAPAQPAQQAQGQSMMQPLAMPMIQPPVVQPPVLQPPVMQPPMMQPVIQPPVMQTPVIQSPMMTVPAPQPAKGKFPWMALSVGLLIGIFLATAVALYLLKH